MQPTVNDVQGVETILTNLLVGYQQAETRFVASRVFPGVAVQNDSGSYPIFTKKYWFTDSMLPRASGAPFATSAFGVEWTTFTTTQFALETAIGDEARKNSQVPMDLEQAAVRFLSQKSLIKKEVAFATDFMAAVWGTSGSVTAKFSDYTASDPVLDVTTAIRTISNATGFEPNTAVMGRIVNDRLRNHPDIMARISYVVQATVANIDNAMNAVFGLPNWYVSKASYNSVNEGQTATMAAIVDDDILICYVSPTPGMYEASAGYTFNWAGGGGMGTIYNVRDNRNHADIIQINEQWDQAVVASDVGYIYLDCTD